MEKENKRLIWDVENLYLFGVWLLSKNVIGHGMLCIIGPAFGFKIGELLTMKWGDFIDDYGTCYRQTHLPENEKKVRTINKFVASYVLLAFEQLQVIRKKPNAFNLLQNLYDEHIFTYTSSGLLLSTSNLNKELKRYYENFKNEMECIYFQKAEFRQPKTNSFEIAWGRNFVKQYRYSKKAFIAVSKELGHPSVQYTSRLLEVNPIDDILIESSDYNPNDKLIEEINEILRSKKDGKGRLYQNELLKFITHEDDNIVELDGSS